MIFTINKLEKRSGSLWEGRFKSSIVSNKEYLLSCSRYIELNPVRAGMVEEPSTYKWSSFAKKVNEKPDSVVDYDFIYKALGKNAAERQRAYHEYVYQTIPEEELKLIRDSIQRNQTTGGNRFRVELEKKLKVRLSNRGPGRPKNPSK